MNVGSIADMSLRRFSGWRFIIRAGRYRWEHRGAAHDHVIDPDDAGHMELESTIDLAGDTTYMPPEVLRRRAYVMNRVERGRTGTRMADDACMRGMLSTLQKHGMCEFSSAPVRR